MREKDYLRSRSIRFMTLLAIGAVVVVTSTRMQAQTGCSAGLGLPFTDLGSMSSVFCQSVAEAYYSGLTNGTTATTYSPSDNVSRAQMAAFITRTLDQSLRRGSRRAALNQYWNTASVTALQLSSTPTGDRPRMIASDGTDVWVANYPDVMRVRASDGKVLGAVNMSGSVCGVLIAMGRIFVTQDICLGGDLTMIDPKVMGEPSGDPTELVAGNLGNGAKGIAFDGTRIWTANDGRNITTPCSAGGGSAGSISFVTPGSSIPWAVTTLFTGFSQPFGILYDGSNIWVTDRGDDRIKKINKFDGTILQSIPVGTDPGNPVFDGMNIWVPNQGSDNITVIRVKNSAGGPLSSAFVVKTLTASFMLGPFTAAFDGERVLVACQTQGIFLFKASDLSFITGISTGPDTTPYGACSDGSNFFVTMNSTDELLRF